MKPEIDRHNSKSARPGTKWIRALGPGLITAALVFGPGSLTITSKLGAMFGNQMFWIIILAIFFMIAYTEMAVRIGIKTNASLLSVIRRKWGRATAVIIGIGIFAITASFQAGNTIGSSLAFSELFHTTTWPWVLFFVALASFLLFFRSFYKILEKVMILLVALMLTSFFITMMIAKPNLAGILRGMVPSIPDGSELLTIALIASSFSIVGAFYQSYLVREKGWSSSQLKEGRRESFAGILILGIISSFIMFNAAAILHPQGITVNSATDMGLALKPVYGDLATSIFMLGLFSASFSSLVGNATIGGVLLSDAFSYGSHLHSRSVRLFILLVMFIGAAIALKYGRLPLELIIFAQGITVTFAPLIGGAMLLAVNDGAIMGNLKNNRWQNTMGALGLLLLVFLAIHYLRLVLFVN